MIRALRVPAHVYRLIRKDGYHFKLVLLGCLVLLYFWLYTDIGIVITPQTEDETELLDVQQRHEHLAPVLPDEIVCLFIVCDGHGGHFNKDLDRQLVQIEVLIKSATALTGTKLRFIVFADSEDLFKKVNSITEDWPEKQQAKISMQYLPVWYPEKRRSMISMFKPCATARLFIPPLLLNEDAIIYLDTDFVFMRPPEDLWGLFRKFGSQELASMATYIRKHGDYKKQKVPLYGDGVNGGIMLMNLTRIGVMSGGWVESNMKIYDQYKKNITMADQDILNILFSQRPELMFDLPCEWNYRKLLCAQGVNRCPITDVEGASLIHGNANAFVNHRENHFQAVFESWRDYEMGNSLSELYLKVVETVGQVNALKKKSSCHRLSNINVVLTEQLKKHHVPV